MIADAVRQRAALADALAAIGHGLPPEFESTGDAAALEAVPARSARARRHGVSRTLAVRGGLVVAPDGAREADILVEDGAISALTAPNEARAPDEIDARGCVVLPGAVDAHVHVGLDYRLMDGTTATSADTYEDASRAAAAGGTTTIIDFAMQVEGEGLVEPLERRLNDIRPSAVDVALHCWMLEANADALRDIPELVARGVPSLKVFLAYSQLGEPMPDEDLLAVWKAVARAGGIMQAHCESWPIIRQRLEEAKASGATGYADFAASRPPVSEADAVGRALALAAASGAETYCVHLSTSGAVEHLRLARMHGLAVHGECCPHHLLLDESRYLGERPGDFVMSPPLRTRRAPRRPLVRAAGRDARGRGSRSRRLAGAHQGAGARVPGGGARRRGQRPAAPPAGRAGRGSRGLWLGARRAPDGREPGPHLPPARQGRDRPGQ